MMDHEDEVRILREQMTALQWALSGTLASCHSIAQHADVDDALLTRIQSLQQAVQNLSASPTLPLTQSDAAAPSDSRTFK